MSEADETQLVAKAKTGDPQAIQQIVNCWYRRVYAHCQARLISSADAEDATQETFMRSVQQFGQLKSDDALGAWLRGIAHHVCVDTIRRNEVRKTQHVDEVPASTADQRPQVAVEAEEQQRRLLAMVHQLPEPLREVVLLHYYEELTYDQIANWIGVARSTVNERLSKARRLLRTELSRHARCADEV